MTGAAVAKHKLKPEALLIDGDILLYRFASSNEFKVQWEEGQEVTKVVKPEEAQFDLAMFVQKMLEKTACLSEAIIFSGANNFRYTVLPSYKHNRVGLEKPALYHQLKAWVVEHFITKEKDTLEGDDVMGIMATAYPGRYKIATIDKDLKQIPGQHFDWNHDKQFTVTVEEADRWFYRQVLTGDPTDGYTGCPKMGPVKADRLLDATPVEKRWDAIVCAYFKAGLTEQDALQQARVARILRASDYDFEKKEIKLWTPASS